MAGFSQFGYNRHGDSLIGRIIAFILGLLVLAVSFVVGLTFFLVTLGLIIIGVLLFRVRLWWLRRKMERYAAEHGDLDAEYTVVREEHRRIDRERR